MEDESANNVQAAAIIASLASKNSSEPRGVRVEQGVNNKSRGAIRRDDEGDGIKDLLQVKSTLASNEIARYKKIFSIFKSVVMPGPEAETLQSAKIKQKLPVQLPKSSGGEAGKGGGSWLKKLIGPALLVLGGLSALVTGLLSDGSAKGLLKILAKVGIGGGVKWFASKFKGIGKSVGKMFKSFGSILLKPFKFLKGGAIKTFFKGMGKKVGILLKPILKRIPGIGSMISWAFAYSRFKKGDVVGGLIDVASGIATLVPGYGTAIGIGLDVLNAFLDYKKGKEEKVKPAGSGFKMGEFFGKIKDKIMTSFPIKNLMEFWGGAADVVGGDIKGGLQRMAFAIPFAKPLADWLFGATNEGGERGGGALAKAGNVMMELKSTLAKKMLSMLPEKMFGISIRARLGKMFGVDMGTVNDEVDNSAVDKIAKYRGTYGRRAGEVGMLEFRKNASAGLLNSPEAIEFAKREKILKDRQADLYAAFATGKSANIKRAESVYAAANVGYMQSQRAFRDAAKLYPPQTVVVQDDDVKKSNAQLVQIANEQTQLFRSIVDNTLNISTGTTVINAGGRASAPARTLNIRTPYVSQ